MCPLGSSSWDRICPLLFGHILTRESQQHVLRTHTQKPSNGWKHVNQLIANGKGCHWKEYRQPCVCVCVCEAWIPCFGAVPSCLKRVCAVSLLSGTHSARIELHYRCDVLRCVFDYLRLGFHRHKTIQTPFPPICNTEHRACKTSVYINVGRE